MKSLLRLLSLLRQQVCLHTWAKWRSDTGPYMVCMKCHKERAFTLGDRSLRYADGASPIYPPIAADHGAVVRFPRQLKRGGQLAKTTTRPRRKANP